MSKVFSFPLRPGRPVWPLTVVGSREIAPRLRRVSLIGESLAGFDYQPGQDLVLGLPTPQGVARRHYTIRAFDRAELRLDVDVVIHGEAPGACWAAGCRIGDPVLAQGPRGRTVINARADWHLFSGDETALPAIAAMLETLPASARAYALIEVGGGEDELPLQTAAELELVWAHRRGPPGPSETLIRQLAAFRFPEGLGQAYVIGETSTVRAQRQGLIARGLAKEQICAEGYWRPGRVGGHDHVDLLDHAARRGRAGSGAAARAG